MRRADIVSLLYQARAELRSHGADGELCQRLARAAANIEAGPYHHPDVIAELCERASELVSIVTSPQVNALAAPLHAAADTLRKLPFGRYSE